VAGFGQVVKCRNRLDGMTYAVKKVELSASSDADNLKTLREVVHLARLVHPHIVRYFVGWIERQDVDEQLDAKALARSSSSFLSPRSEDENDSGEDDDDGGGEEEFGARGPQQA
jgi:serine/threonine protein kinase